MLRFLQWLENTEKIAQYFQRAAEEIAKIHNGRTVVVLGRDTQPLFSLLVRKGIKAQYFLYSQKQIGDKTTKERWLEEVPPHSLVVDIGVRGSILKDIKKFDPTIQGFVLHAALPNEFQYLTSDDEHDDLIQSIEDSPKPIGRTTGYHRRWNVKASPEDRATKNSFQTYCNSLMKNMNFSDDEISKWCSFSGVTIWQRLGLKRGDWKGLMQHVNQVYDQRRAKQNLAGV
jgi:hypothetical protein